jgi:transposase-like protein
LDETCVNGLKYWVYAAIDVDRRNEILSMRVFPSRNALTTKIFVEHSDLNVLSRVWAR